MTSTLPRYQLVLYEEPQNSLYDTRSLGLYCTQLPELKQKIIWDQMMHLHINELIMQELVHLQFSLNQNSY